MSTALRPDPVRIGSADAPSRCRDTGPALPAVAWTPVLLVVAAKLAINLAMAGRYGWHRDELYYADTASHLAWGYVDFPSLTPLLAALARSVGGESLVVLRSVASLAGAAVIVVTAVLARDLGGGRRAQVMAAIAITPLVVGSNAMFQTVSFDQLGWALVIWAAARLLLCAPVRRNLLWPWAAVGAAAALAWSNKYTVGVLLGALAVAWLVCVPGRATLRGRGPLLAAALVAVVCAPNLWWQARHGWPSVDFFAGRNSAVRDEYPPVRFALELVVLAGPLAVPLALLGLRRLVTDVATRPLGIGLAVVAPLWLVLGGKSYYAAPLLVGAFAAGAVAWEARLARSQRGRRTWLWPATIAGTALAALPIIGPALPTATMVDLGLHEVRDDYAEELGWPELAATVDEEWAALDPTLRTRTVVIASNYGEAGALTRFGSHEEKEMVVVSGHLTHRLWPLHDEAGQADHALLVGYQRASLADLCAAQPVRVATITNRWGVENEEAGRGVWRCDLEATVAELRPRLAHDG